MGRSTHRRCATLLFCYYNTLAQFMSLLYMSSPELHFKIMAFQHVSKSLVKQQEAPLPHLKRINNRFHARQRLLLHFNKKRAEQRHGPLTVRHNRSLSQALNQSSGATNDNVPLSQTLSSEEERPASPRRAL